MTIALLLDPSMRSSQSWIDALQTSIPEEPVLWFDDVPDPRSIDIAIVRGVDPGDLSKLVNLQFIQCLWAGIDKLLSDPLVPSRVPLARTVDPAMADQMAASCLAHVLDVCLLHDRYREQQSRSLWQPGHAPSISARTIAILGFGTLGRRCAEYLQFAGANVVGVRSHRSGTESITEAVANADVVVNLLPLTDDTVGILNSTMFAACRTGASLINLGRGAHLVEADLLDALARGHLSRAVLDVFHTEPLPTEHPFWQHPNITVTPHVAAETDPTTAAPVIAANIRAFRRGRPDQITGLVDRSKGY